MIILSCTNITKSYIVDTIIENISFSINEGEKIGLVGLNGAGKTTLFNILTNTLEYDEGNIYIAKGKKVGYLKQNTRIKSNNTIINEMIKIFSPLIKIEQNIRELENKISNFTEDTDSDILNKYMNDYSELNEKFEAMNGYGYKSIIRGVLKGLGFSENEFDKPINLLSGGQKSRVMLAKLLLEKPDILLLDEPTNHLDIEAISWLEKFINDFKGSAIIISHDRYFLDNTISRVFLLQDKILKSYNGNYSEFMNKRKVEIELLKKKYEEQEKEITRQEELIKRLQSYGSKRNIRQAFSRQKALDKIKKVEPPPYASKKVKLKFSPKIRSGREVLKVSDLSKSFGKHKLFNNINFDIYRGDKIGVIGPNGIGKTTLLKILSDKILDFSGQIIKGHYVKTGYYDQEQINLNDENTVIDEIWDENPKLDYYQIRTMLARFLFMGDELFKIIGDLSGGEKGRLSLLKLMLSNSNFLLMDEPTNHLDIDSKEVLEEALINYDGTILVVSHDRYFLNKVTTKIFDMSSTGLYEYLGNYDYYVEKKAELEEEDEKITDVKTKTQLKHERKKERENLREIKIKNKQIKDIEKLISENESLLSELENVMCQQETYNDKTRVMEVQEKISSTKSNLDNLYEKWAELND